MILMRLAIDDWNVSAASYFVEHAVDAEPTTISLSTVDVNALARSFTAGTSSGGRGE